MSDVLAIDPGNVQSAYALINRDRRPLVIGKVDNHDLRRALPALSHGVDHIAIEMIASYGMPVGAEVFETAVWIGRFLECCYPHEDEVQLVYRRDVKLHHCHSAKAKDSNISQALIDRFAPGTRNHGKGTKAAPGFFYGFKADVWQAYALAVYVADVRTIRRARRTTA